MEKYKRIIMLIERIKGVLRITHLIIITIKK